MLFTFFLSLFGCTKYHRLDDVQDDELQKQKEFINDFHSDDFYDSDSDSDSGCDPDCDADCDSGAGSVSTGEAKSTKDYWTDERMEKAKPIPMEKNN